MQVDFTSQEYFRDPAAGIEKLRAGGPVIQVRFPMVGRVWIVTTYALASRVLKDSETFTIQKDGAVAGYRWWTPGILRAITHNMMTVDEPDHTRLRGIVDEAFRRRAILEMEPRVLAIADKLAGQLFAAGSPADLVERYARQLPLKVVCELLGLPPADRALFETWAGRFTRITGPVGLLTMVPTLRAMKRYLEQHLDTVRRVGGEGLIADLVRIEQGGDRLSAGEAVAMVFMLFAASAETTTHLIAGSVYELLRNPGLRDWLAADWDRAEPAVEEFLRFCAPGQFSNPRFVQKDVDLAGVRVGKGERIMAMLAGANFDPDANAEPARLDLERQPNRHLAFGAGPHFCLGHQLARIEGKCALQALFRRWPDLELGVADAKIRWASRPGLRAMTELPVRQRGRDSSGMIRPKVAS